MLGHLYLCVTRYDTVFLSECYDGTKTDKLTFVDRIHANVFEWTELKEIYYLDRSKPVAKIPTGMRQLKAGELVEANDKITDNHIDYTRANQTQIGKPAGNFVCVVRPMGLITIKINDKLITDEKSEVHRLQLMQELFLAEKLKYALVVDDIRVSREWIYDNYAMITLITVKKIPMTVEEFHKERTMFFLYGKTMMVYSGDKPLTHKEWLSEMFGVGTDNLIETYPRGYTLNGVLAIYRGKDFKDDISLKEITVIGHMMSGFNRLTHVHLGAIPGPDQPWKPKRCLTREDVLEMQRAAGYPPNTESKI